MSNIVNEICVSVCISTYNHEEFIVEALNSVLNQEFDFNYEVILSNDYSSDRTHEVIIDFLKDHPKKEKVKYYNQQKNLGINDNLIFTLEHASGNYIALLEGDDFWTNSKKLQKQYDFLENHLNYTICTGGYESITPEGLVVRKYDGDIKGVTYDLKNLTHFRAHYLNMFFRSNSLDKEKLCDFKYSGDNVIFLFCLAKGKGYFFNEIFGFRRTHAGGLWTSKSNFERIKMGSEQIVGLYRYPVFKKYIRPSLFHTYIDLTFHEKATENYTYKAIKLVRTPAEALYIAKLLMYSFIKRNFKIS